VQNARQYAKHRKILRKNALLVRSGKRRKEDRLSVTLLLAASVSDELNDPTVDRVYQPRWIAAMHLASKGCRLASVSACIAAILRCWRCWRSLCLIRRAPALAQSPRCLLACWLHRPHVGVAFDRSQRHVNGFPKI
jgi:hypothetical protein